MIDSLILSFRARWKVFILSLVVQFIIASLLHLGARVPEYLNFLQVSSIQHRAAGLISPQKTSGDIWQIIQSRLEQKPNDFRLQKIAEAQILSGPTKAYAAFSDAGSAGARYQQARAYTAVDLDTGKVLIEGNGNQSLPIASLTKIMTAVVALDLASLEEKFAVSRTAAAITPTKIGVVPGQRIPLKDLLHALLMTSANDGAQVIKEGVDQKYSENVFIQAMNAKAKFLGLKNTHFANSQGLDSGSSEGGGLGNVSSVSDLAVLSAYALKNYPAISEIVKKDYQFVPATADHKQFDLYNWNGLLDVYPGVYGIKIGNTEDAGYTTVVVSERGGHRIAAVVLGAPGAIERDIWASQLLDEAFAEYGLPKVRVTEEQLKQKYATWKYWG